MNPVAKRLMLNSPLWTAAERMTVSPRLHERLGQPNRATRHHLSSALPNPRFVITFHALSEPFAPFRGGHKMIDAKQSFACGLGLALALASSVGVAQTN